MQSLENSTPERMTVKTANEVLIQSDPRRGVSDALGSLDHTLSTAVPRKYTTMPGVGSLLSPTNSLRAEATF